MELTSWGDLAIVIWFFLSVYAVFKDGWLYFSDPQGAFPFSFKQFFFSGLSLFVAFGIFIAALYCAHSLVGLLQKSFLSSHLFRSYGQTEWVAVEQLISLVLAAIGLRFLISHIPQEYVSNTVGQEGNWKKWVKGAFFEIFFYPLIAFIATIIQFVTHYNSGEGPVPQVALNLLSGLQHTTVLFWIVFASIIFLVPYVEEILFRGFLQGFLGGVFTPFLNILGTSFVFSIFHYSPLQKSSNFEIIAGLFVFSLFLSRLRVRENTVVASMGMHAAFNATSLAIFMM